MSEQLRLQLIRHVPVLYELSIDTLYPCSVASLGEPCTGERICQTADSFCGDDGVCTCKEEFERSNDGHWCRLQKSLGIHFPVLNEECSGGFFSDCYMGFEQECLQGRCTCHSGLRPITGDGDMKALFPDVGQCRNASINDSEREAFHCRNEIRRQRKEDVYDKAKARRVAGRRSGTIYRRLRQTVKLPDIRLKYPDRSAPAMVTGIMIQLKSPIQTPSLIITSRRQRHSPDQTSSTLER
ncbi:uncharacterized protein LOC128228424 [Mya arenaria]|uniref:uncharacterized protein LOC128228424 n=1 Tax=Mya arenaria TaxID=6604 RepID=UPI0022E8AAF3|nr:uncharacterized protein LOC128228424 [Mya arenaria]